MALKYTNYGENVHSEFLISCNKFWLGTGRHSACKTCFNYPQPKFSSGAPAQPKVRWEKKAG